MNFHSDAWIMDNVKRHYQEALKLYDENRIVGIFYQGSGNYGLDFEGSDVDTKLIIIPTFEDIVLNKKLVSTTHVLSNNEHLDAKDIRLMFQTFKKQNINFIEILFTKYSILNPFFQDEFQPVIDNRERITHYNNYVAVNCMAGMSMEKFNALEHPYPSLIEEIENYGFCSKQLHHIIRMNEFIKRYISGEDFEKCLISKQAEYLKQVKMVPPIYSLDEARIVAKTTNEDTYNVKKKYMENNSLKINNDVDDIFKQTLIDILRKSLRKEIL